MIVNCHQYTADGATLDVTANNRNVPSIHRAHPPAPCLAYKARIVSGRAACHFRTHQRSAHWRVLLQLRWPEIVGTVTAERFDMPALVLRCRPTRWIPTSPLVEDIGLGNRAFITRFMNEVSVVVDILCL